MENFEFMSPTRFVLGKDAECTVGSEIKRYTSKALFVHYGDQYMYDSGLHERITTSLKEAQIDFVELTGVQPNPILTPVYEGIKICRDNDIDFVLAVGGGSVIDTAKAIAAGVPFEGDVWKLYKGEASLQKALPVGAVMTLPGTGSEASNGSVITNEETGRKLDIMGDVLRPVFALMNPEVTYTLPPFHTACGIVDMISHAMERYFTSSQNTDLTDRLGEAVMKTCIKSAYAVLENPKDYNARAELMWAAILAHNGLTGTGRNQDWSCHMMGAQLSGEYNAVHGATLSVLIPNWANYVYKSNVKRFAQFASRVFDVEYDLNDLKGTAKMGIKRLIEFYKDLNMPITLSEININSEDKFEMMASNATGGGAIGCIQPLSTQDVVNIYKMAK